ncbi:MAG: hypothetical protein NZM06_01755 [Chloroherpetonaceae bacterium]|nr:hypothetical protein [Chloroherpetonaceae bacterium]MDW8437209.1 hypothetical protein [Chloroherpetonaceae bacterium]
MKKMKTSLQVSALFALALLAFASCKEDEKVSEPKPELQIPSFYDSTGYAANVATESQVRAQLSALTRQMQVGRHMDSTVSLASLRALYNGTTLQSVTGASYRAKVDTALVELARASGKGARYAWENAPTGDGGVIPTTTGGRTGYLYDENVLEMEQVVEKGLFAAAMYNHAVALINSGNITTATIDRLVEIYGAKPGFGNNERNSDPNRDRFSAQYAARRSDSANANSLYAKIKRNLITAKAAVKAGSAFNQQRDQALADFKLNWEKALAATVINYCHSTLAGLTATTRNDSTVTSAMHAYGEAIGFLSGWKAVPASQRKITDAQIDELLALLRAPFDRTANAQSHLFLSGNSATAQLYRLDGRNDPNVGAIERLQQIYGFADAEVEDFRRNWVALQNRR